MDDDTKLRSSLIPETLEQVSTGILAAELSKFVILIAEVGWSTAVASLAAPLTGLIVGVAGIFGITKKWKYAKDAQNAKQAARQLEDWIKAQDNLAQILERIQSQLIDLKLDWVTKEEMMKACHSFVEDELPGLKNSIADFRDENRIYHETHDHHLRTLLERTETLVRQCSGGTRRLTRLEQLQMLLRESIARCEVRWLAAQVQPDKARDMADDSHIGDPAADFIPNPRQPLRVLLGDFGVGKSLLADRMFQLAIARAIESDEAPVPVFVKALDVADRFDERVAEACKGIGTPQRLGASVIVDEADALDLGRVESLLQQSRILVRTWPTTTVVITSRPVAPFDAQPEAVTVPPLDIQDSLGLVSYIADADVTRQYYSWPNSVIDAIRRPLFAILRGLAFRHGDSANPQSAGEMIDFLVQQALGDSASSERLHALLQRLAVSVINHNQATVTAAEVGNRKTIRALLESRLVFKKHTVIGFALPILAEWFGAESIRAGSPSYSELLDTPKRLDRWRYPLAIFVATASHHDVSKLLGPLCETHPAFAAEVVNEAISSSWASREICLPPALDCASRLRACTLSWAKGAGPLARLIAPMRGADEVCGVGVQTHHGSLSVWWDTLGYTSADEFEFAHGAVGNKPGIIQWGHPAPQAAWAWRWSLETLRTRLRERVESHSLPMTEGPIADEELWTAAVTASGRPHVPHTKAIDVKSIAWVLDSPGDIIMLQQGTIRGWRLALLKQKLAELVRLGEAKLQAPWPLELDMPPGRRIWDGYSDEELATRTERIFHKALMAYQSLVDTWLGAFRDRLETAVLLPLRIVATFYRRHSSAMFPEQPCVDWHMEPLPVHELSTVQLTCSNTGEGFRTSRAAAQDVFNHMLQLRPHARWLRASWHREAFDRRLFSDQPATDLAYEWLVRDLKRVGWLPEP